MSNKELRHTYQKYFVQFFQSSLFDTYMCHLCDLKMFILKLGSLWIHKCKDWCLWAILPLILIGTMWFLDVLINTSICPLYPWNSFFSVETMIWWARSCFQYCPLIGDEGDKITKKITGRARVKTADFRSRLYINTRTINYVKHLLFYCSQHWPSHPDSRECVTQHETTFSRACCFRSAQ